MLAMKVEIYFDSYRRPDGRCPRCGSRNVAVEVQAEAAQTATDADARFAFEFVEGRIRCRECGYEAQAVVTQTDDHSYDIEAPETWSESREA